MWFDVAPSGLQYALESPCRIESEVMVYATPERVFDVLTGQVRDWFADVQALRWTSPAPYGVQSTRELDLKMLSVRERILAWDRGIRFAYSVDACTLPIVRRMVGDVHFEAVGPNHTRLRHTIHYTPTLAARLVHPAMRAVFTKMFRDATRAIAGIAATPAAANKDGMHVAA